MTPQELLQPRFEVIADYPKSKFKIGDILQCTQDEETGQFRFYKEKGGYYRDFWFSQYPHLFKPLHWASHRDISDLPKYVKLVSGYIIEVTWHIRSDNVLVMANEPTYSYLDFFEPTNQIPATEAEYLTFINSTK